MGGNPVTEKTRARAGSTVDPLPTKDEMKEKFCSEIKGARIFYKLKDWERLWLLLVMKC